MATAQKLDCVGDSQPVGYYGLSQGGGMGMHLVEAEPRITAAVLGLDESDVLIRIAPRITIRFFGRHLGSQGTAL